MKKNNWNRKNDEGMEKDIEFGEDMDFEDETDFLNRKKSREEHPELSSEARRNATRRPD